MSLHFPTSIASSDDTKPWICKDKDVIFSIPTPLFSALHNFNPIPALEGAVGVPIPNYSMLFYPKLSQEGKEPHIPEVLGLTSTTLSAVQKNNKGGGCQSPCSASATRVNLLKRDQEPRIKIFQLTFRPWPVSYLRLFLVLYLS